MTAGGDKGQKDRDGGVAITGEKNKTEVCWIKAQKKTETVKSRSKGDYYATKLLHYCVIVFKKLSQPRVISSYAFSKSSVYHGSSMSLSEPQ